MLIDQSVVSQFPAAERLSAALYSRHIPKLDALRAISALLVMLYHFGYPIPAGFGVTVFFVISGFLITWLLLEERAKTGGTSLKAFYLRRSFRIFPAFYAYWFLIITIQVVRHHAVLWGQAVSAFFYVCNYYQGLNGYPTSALARTWSLAVEEQFYLLWPFLFARFRDSRQLLRILSWLIGLIWVCRWVLYSAGVPEYYLYTAFESRADAIFVGCWLSIAIRNRSCDKWVQAVCSHWGLIWLTVGLMGLSVVLENRYTWNYRDPIGHLVNPLLVAVLLVQVLAIEWRPLAILDIRPVRFLGLISYSTYLYHGLAPIPQDWPTYLKVIPSYMLAAGSYFCIEKPFLRMRDGFISRFLVRRAPTG